MLVSGQLPDMKPGLVSLLVGGGAALSLLGAGEGPLSCPAFPYRAALTSWPGGRPASRPCCDEYGYCRPEQFIHWISIKMKLGQDIYSR